MQLSPGLKRCSGHLGFALFCMFSAALAINLLAQVHIGLGAADLSLRAALAPGNRGTTSLVVTPVGRVAARTHAGPMQFIVSLENIDLDGAKALADISTGGNALEGVKRAGSEALPRLATMVVGCGMIGGVLGSLVYGRRCGRALILAAAIGLAPSALPLFAAWMTFDSRGFAAPSYSGILQAAPWVLGAIDGGMMRGEMLRESLAAITDNLDALMSPVDPTYRDGDDSTVRILHVSDIHNNPAGHELIRRLAGQFGIHAVIDTGDLVDWGTEIEADLAQSIQDLGLPYLFVPGNHESPQVISRLSRVPNLTVLLGNIVTIEGLSVLGFADPASLNTSPAVSGDGEYAAAAEEVMRLVAGAREPVDIVAVHNVKAAASAVGSVPVVLHGHDHRMSVTWDSGTAVVNAGTTGAAGIRGLTSRADIPYTLAILHFRRPGYPDPDSVDGNHLLKRAKLMAVDTIEVSPIRSGFAVKRHTPGR